MKRFARVALAGAIAVSVPLVFAACGRRRHGAHVAPAASGSAVTFDDDAPPIAEVDLSIGVADARRASILHAEKQVYFDLVDELEKFRESDRKALFVRFGAARIGWSRAQELGRTMRELREGGKKIECYGDELGNAAYWLAATGCDRVTLSPAGGLDTIGLGTELVFAKDLLAKLGVDADVLQVGKYKGVADMVTRSTASDEVKASIGGTLGDIRATWLDGIAAARKKPELRAAVEAGPYSSEEAKQLGLVDDVAYESDARWHVEREVRSDRFERIYGRGVKKDGGDLIAILRALTGAKRPHGGGPAHVAVLAATGAIAMEPGGGVLGTEVGIDARTMTKRVRELAADDSTKAVVLRIDSPGGSALASDLLWHELMQLRKKKPLVVSIGDMAASGGYYLACTGSKVVAEDTSIIGSIGVVGGKLAIANALKPYGVNVEPLAASPAPSASATRATYLSVLTPWDDATKERVLATMTSVYDLFVARVAEGRGMPKDRVATFAEGRIFSGREGKERGMVDAIGGLSESIALAKLEAKLGDDVEIRLIADQPDVLEQLGLADDDETRASRERTELVRAVLPRPDEVLPYVESLGPLASGGERALVAVPFALLIPLGALSFSESVAPARHGPPSSLSCTFACGRRTAATHDAPSSRVAARAARERGIGGARGIAPDAARRTQDGSARGVRVAEGAAPRGATGEGSRSRTKHRREPRALARGAIDGA